MDLKIKNNLFLGRQELQFFQDSLKNQGYEKLAQLTYKQFGVVKLPSVDPDFDFLRVVQGTAINKLTILEGLAVDKNIDMIHAKSDLVDFITVPTDSVTRYVIAQYENTSVEMGSVSVDIFGAVTGVNTSFTEKLRGLPDFPSKIKFKNSANNTGEYTIQSVISDTSLQLNVASGIMIAESDLEYEIVGTFTPGIAVPSIDKFPFMNDGYDIRLDVSDIIAEGEEFILAEVVSNGSVTSITDRRLESILEINPPESENPSSTNALIGIEEAKYQNKQNPGDTNRVKIGWGMKVSNGSWSYDPSLNQITVTAGKGGSWGDISSHTDGDLDGWLIYFGDSGKTARIRTSTNGTGLILQLEPSVSFLTTQDIKIVPNSEFIEIITTPAGAVNTQQKNLFHTYLGEGILNISPFYGSVSVKYRLINKEKSTPYKVINDGTYLSEGSFDADGNLNSAVYGNVTGAAITLQPYPDNFYEQKAWRNKPNVFTGLQQENLGNVITYNGTNAAIMFDNSGNVFDVIINQQIVAYIGCATGSQEGTMIHLRLVAGTASQLDIWNTGGPSFVPSADRISAAPFVAGANVVTYKAGDILTFLKAKDELGVVKWNLISAKSSANVGVIRDVWENDTYIGNTFQNTSSIGTGTDTLIGSLPSTQAPQPGSFLKRKRIGTTIFVQFHLVNMTLSSHDNAPASSIVIRPNGIPFPSARAHGTAKVLCHTHTGIAVNGVQPVIIYAGTRDIIIQAYGLNPTPLKFNREYNLNPPSVELVESGATSFFPRFTITGEITYEA